MIIVCCDGTVNGIFTAIYRAWEIGTSKTKISVSQNENIEMFAEYMTVESDEILASKVTDSIKRKISDKAYEQVYHAALSYESDRGEAIYRFLIEGFRHGADIIYRLGLPCVQRIFQLNRNVARETHNYLGFLRFNQCKLNNNSLMLACFDPKNNILDEVSHHFTDRLLLENWIIADTKRNICSLHKSESRQYIITDISGEDIHNLITLVKENTYDHFMEELWESFRESIAITERKNEKLQRNLMPLRYRSYMNIHK